VESVLFDLSEVQSGATGRFSICLESKHSLVQCWNKDFIGRQQQSRGFHVVVASTPQVMTDVLFEGKRMALTLHKIILRNP